MHALRDLLSLAGQQLLAFWSVPVAILRKSEGLLSLAESVNAAFLGIIDASSQATSCSTGQAKSVALYTLHLVLNGVVLS